MRLPFALRLALRESRASGRRLGVYMGAITLGVAALVAINSFRAGVTDSVEAESKSLLGADLRLSSGRPFPDSVAAVIDSVATAGVDVSRVTGTLSVALAPSGNTRLVQVRAVTDGYPYYGDVVTEPDGLWTSLAAGRDAVVEPALLIALDAQVGDTLRIGDSGFRIAGVLTKAPLEIGFQSAIAPRVYIADAWLADAGLVRFGSIVSYQAFLRIPDPAELQRFEDRHHDLFRRSLVRSTTAAEQADDLTEGLDWMARFLGLVGLTALLLGGLGVGSAIHVFVREKRTQVAVLRCLGATRRTAFTAYLFQSALLGFAGATAGAVLGVATQGVLPGLLGDAIPVTVSFHIYWAEVAAGIGVGAWVAIAFALLPLLGVRTVPPLQALRQDVEPPARRIDPWRALTWAGLAASVAGISVLQAPDWQSGLAFAASLAVAIIILRGVAFAMMRAARRLFPRRAGFAVRQGVSGLFRPSNQTAAVIVALGFGVFLIATIWVVQTNLLDRFLLDPAEQSPDLVAFDIQPDQREGVAGTFVSLGAPPPTLVPIVPARIAAINGVTSDSLLGTARVRDIEPWALRREYRNTWRAELTSSEQIIEGSWWDGDAPAGRADLPRVSIEESLVRSLDLQLGDRITWDFQGVPIETRVTSIRTVDWTRFDTNFFVVFEPGTIDDAPQSWVTLAHVPDATTRGRIQSQLARGYPNVSTLDLSLVQETITDVIDRITLAIRFMAIFAVAGGIIVLAGALAAGRLQRAREAVLLRTLGATRPTVRRILFTEYAALGTLAGLSGALMAGVAGWILVHFFFKLPFRLPVLPLLLAWLGIAGLSIAIGAAGNRSILRDPPLAALRNAE